MAPPTIIGATESQCPICFEPYDIGSSPAHSPAALQCGHVFGETCVRQWIAHAMSANPPRKPICPSCKLGTAMCHVLPLFTDFKVFDSADVISQLKAANSESLTERNNLAKENRGLSERAGHLSLKNKGLSEKVERLSAEKRTLSEANERLAEENQGLSEEAEHLFELVNLATLVAIAAGALALMCFGVIACDRLFG